MHAYLGLCCLKKLKNTSLLCAYAFAYYANRETLDQSVYQNYSCASVGGLVTTESPGRKTKGSGHTVYMHG